MSDQKKSRGSFWQSLLAKKSGVRTIRSIDSSALPVHIAGEIDFKANDYVDKKDRKSLKMMARTIQLGLAGANLAMKDCGMSGLRQAPPAAPCET